MMNSRVPLVAAVAVAVVFLSLCTLPTTARDLEYNPYPASKTVVKWKEVDVTMNNPNVPGEQVGAVARIEDGVLVYYFITTFKFLKATIDTDAQTATIVPIAGIPASAGAISPNSYPILHEGRYIILKTAPQCLGGYFYQDILSYDLDEPVVNKRLKRLQTKLKAPQLNDNPEAGLSMVSVNETFIAVLAYQYSDVYRSRQLYMLNHTSMEATEIEADPTATLAFRKYHLDSPLAKIQNKLYTIGNQDVFGKVPSFEGNQTFSSLFSASWTMSSSASGPPYSTTGGWSSASYSTTAWSSASGYSSSVSYSSSWSSSSYSSSWSSSSSSWSGSTSYEWSSTYSSSSWGTTASSFPSTGYSSGPTGYSGPSTGYSGPSTGYSGPSTGYSSGPSSGYATGPSTGYSTGPSTGYTTGSYTGPSTATYSTAPSTYSTTATLRAMSKWEDFAPAFSQSQAGFGARASKAAAAGKTFDYNKRNYYYDWGAGTGPIGHGHNDDDSMFVARVTPEQREVELALLRGDRNRYFELCSKEESRKTETRNGARSSTAVDCFIRPDLLTETVVPRARDFWAYDIETNKWASAVEPGNFPFFSVPGFTSMVSNGDVLLVAGGAALNTTMPEPFNRQRMFAWHENEWTELSAVPPSFGQTAMLAVATANGYAVAFGGYRMPANPYAFIDFRIVTKMFMADIVCPNTTQVVDGNCIDCSPGNFFDRDTQTCQPCDGGYTSISGATQCKKCPDGQGPNAARTGCEPCEKGYYSSHTASWAHAATNGVCVPCNPGYIQPSLGSTTCYGCPEGQYKAEEGGFECDLCEVNTYNDKVNRTSCTDCPGAMTIEFAEATSLDQCSCGEGYWYVESYCEKMSNGKRGEDAGTSPIDCCAPCPSGGQCSGVARSPIPTDGYWCDEDTPAGELKVCNYRDACKGGSCDGEMTCAKGYTGYICGECETGRGGYYKLGARCEKCPEISSDYWIWIPCVGAGVAFTLFILCQASFKQMSPAARKKILQRKKKLAEAKDMKEDAEEKHEEHGKKVKGVATLVIPVSLISTIAIGVNFLQMTALIGSFNMDWPDNLFDFLNFWSVMNVNIEIASPECTHNLSYADKYLFSVFIPVMFAGFLGVLFAWQKVTHFLRYDLDEPAHLDTLWGQFKHDLTHGYAVEGLEDIFNSMVKVFLTVLSVSYIFLSTKALEPFSTIKVNDSTRVLSQSTSIEFGSSEWSRILPFAIGANIFYAIGIPASFAFILFRNRDRIMKLDMDFRKRFGVLYASYDRDSYYWSVVLMLRRIGIVVAKLLIPPESVLVQGVVATLVLFSTLTAHAVVKPFKSNKADRVETMSIVVNLFTLFAGISFEIIEDGEATNELRNQFQRVAMYVVSATVFITFLAIVQDIYKIYKVFKGVARSVLDTEEGQMLRDKLEDASKNKLRGLLDRQEDVIFNGASTHMPRDKIIMLAKFNKLRTTDDEDRENLFLFMRLMSQYCERGSGWDFIELDEETFAEFGLDNEEEESMEDSDEDEDEDEEDEDFDMDDEPDDAMGLGDMEADNDEMADEEFGFQVEEIVGMDDEDDEDEDEEEEEDVEEEEEPAAEEPAAEEPAAAEQPTTTEGGGGEGEGEGETAPAEEAPAETATTENAQTENAAAPAAAASASGDEGGESGSGAKSESESEALSSSDASGSDGEGEDAAAAGATAGEEEAVVDAPEIPTSVENESNTDLAMEGAEKLTGMDDNRGGGGAGGGAAGAAAAYLMNRGKPQIEGILCDVCFEEADLEAAADVYCRQCNGYMCGSCAGVRHTGNKADHYLATISRSTVPCKKCSAPAGEAPEDAEDDVEMFCDNCTPEGADADADATADGDAGAASEGEGEGENNATPDVVPEATPEPEAAPAADAGVATDATLAPTEEEESVAVGGGEGGGEGEAGGEPAPAVLTDESLAENNNDAAQA